MRAPDASCSGTGIAPDFEHTRDLPALFAALAQPTGIFNFLQGSVDSKRVALAGHAEGAGYAADNGAQPGVKAILTHSLRQTSRGVQREIWWVSHGTRRAGLTLLSAHQTQRSPAASGPNFHNRFTRRARISTGCRSQISSRGLV